MKSTTDDPEYRPFHTSNPPSSEEAAEERIAFLEGAIEAIKAQLANTSLLTFDRDGSYGNWRGRATQALGHRRRELAFIQMWLRRKRLEQEKADKQRRHDEQMDRAATNRKKKEEARGQRARGRDPALVSIAESLRKRAEELSAAIGPKYTRVYSKESVPSTAKEASARSAQLVAIKLELQAALSEVGSEWCSHPLDRKAMPKMKAPLTRILMEVEAELAIVTRVAREADAPTRVDWKQVCVAAIERAVVQGFQLTELEQQVLQGMREHI